MPAATLTVGNVEITAILDVDTSMPLAEIFGESGDPPPGGSGSLAARYPDEFTADAWHFRDHCFLVRTPTRLTLIDTGGFSRGPAYATVFDPSGNALLDSSHNQVAFNAGGQKQVNG